MRIIKFRYWEKPDASVNFEGKMHYNSDEYFNKWCGNPEYETMQFTGLLDRNGKEIYEGDIVVGKELEVLEKKEKYWKEVVVWMNGFWSPPMMTLMEAEPEIIGNIYENPELISKSK